MDLRGLSLSEPTLATAQAGAPTGFTAGSTYRVKAVGYDNTGGLLYALILDNNQNMRAVALPTSGAGPFTFQ